MTEFACLRSGWKGCCVARRFGLHVAGAYVGGGGGGVFGVEVLLDDLIEGALGVEDEVDGVAAGAVATGVGGDVVGHGFDLRARVGGGDGEAADAHDREVDDVVADVGHLLHGDAGFGGDLLGGGEFVGLALVDPLELEVAGADGDGLGLALGDDAYAKATEAGERDAEAVVGGEAFDFNAGADRVFGGAGGGDGSDDDLSVGEDAIDVEDEDFDVAGAVFRGGGHTGDDTGAKVPDAAFQSTKIIVEQIARPQFVRKTRRFQPESEEVGAGLQRG